MAMASRVAALILAVAGFAAVLCVVSSGDVGRQALRAGRRLQVQVGAPVQPQVGAPVQPQVGAPAESQFGSGFGGQVMQTGEQAVTQAGQYGNVVSTASRSPFDLIAEKFHFNGIYGVPFYVLQMIFATIYGCVVVNNYPYMQGPTQMSSQLQADAAPCATTRASPSNCCLAWICPQARAAHTFDKTGTLEYWCGCVAMFLCPFCTLCFTNACTDLNAKLGGQDQNPIAAALCAWLCFCCTIAQDAESLDLATGAETTPCGVNFRQSHHHQGHPMGPPQMHMQGPHY